MKEFWFLAIHSFNCYISKCRQHPWMNKLITIDQFLLKIHSCLVVRRLDYCTRDNWFKSRFGVAISYMPPVHPAVMRTYIAGSQRLSGVLLRAMAMKTGMPWLIPAKWTLAANQGATLIISLLKLFEPSTLLGDWRQCVFTCACWFLRGWQKWGQWMSV